MATETLKTAKVLAFERKLDPSDALFFAGEWSARKASADWVPVPVREKSVRGTISNRLKTKSSGDADKSDSTKSDSAKLDPAKLDAAIQNPNPQTVDVAALPRNAD